MHTKEKNPLHFVQNIVYKLSCAEGRCSQSYIDESSRYLENRVKEHSSQVTSTIYIHNESNNHPLPNISHFKVKDQDNKQFTKEAR